MVELIKKCVIKKKVRHSTYSVKSKFMTYDNVPLPTFSIMKCSKSSNSPQVLPALHPLLHVHQKPLNPCSFILILSIERLLTGILTHQPSNHCTEHGLYSSVYNEKKVC